jgi:hypothetical protein
MCKCENVEMREWTTVIMRKFENEVFHMRIDEEIKVLRKARAVYWWPTL